MDIRFIEKKLDEIQDGLNDLYRITSKINIPPKIKIELDGQFLLTSQKISWLKEDLRKGTRKWF